MTLATDELDTEATKQAVVEALRKVYDPEIPVSLYDLGLIYDIIVAPTGKVDIVMTLTAPACPVADILPMEVEKAARSVDGVISARVELVFDPPWRPDMMSEAARLELGMF
jgi:FeS assembly SUF system protein